MIFSFLRPKLSIINTNSIIKLYSWYHLHFLCTQQTPCFSVYFDRNFLFALFERLQVLFDPFYFGSLNFRCCLTTPAFPWRNINDPTGLKSAKVCRVIWTQFPDLLKAEMIYCVFLPPGGHFLLFTQTCSKRLHLHHSQDNLSSQIWHYKNCTAQ